MTSPVDDVGQRDAPPRAVSDSIAALTAPQDATVVTAANSAGGADAEALLLALHVAADEAGGVHRRGRVALGGVDDRHAGDEEDGHRDVDRPALAAAADHAAERGREPGRDREDREHEHEVRERRAVLERHRGVDVVEAAAVGPELLDELLRGDRAEGEGLRSAGERLERRRRRSVWTTPWETRNREPTTQIGSRT